MNFILILLTFLFSTLTYAGDPNLEAVLQKLQKNYENISSFSADFEQTYSHKIFKKVNTSSGKVAYKKPGRMRFDYENPSVKSFIVDGKSLWIYQKEDKSAFVDRCFKQDGLTASIAFLWGLGKIKKQFEVSWSEPPSKDSPDFHLALTPKEKNSIFKQLILVVDGKNYQVKQSTLVDLEGNKNQFAFKNLLLNPKKMRASFAFIPPKGTHVSNLPGSCAIPSP